MMAVRRQPASGGSAQADHPAALRPEVFRLFAEGIEGVSYGLRSDGSGLYEKLPGASDYWPDVDWVVGQQLPGPPRAARPT